MNGGDRRLLSRTAGSMWQVNRARDLRNLVAALVPVTDNAYQVFNAFYEMVSRGYENGASLSLEDYRTALRLMAEFVAHELPRIISTTCRGSSVRQAWIAVMEGLEEMANRDATTPDTGYESPYVNSPRGDP